MPENNKILGVGSRVKHPALGDGVVVKVNVAAYQVCFMTYGIKDVGKQYDKWEIIDHVPFDEISSFGEAEKALIRILETYNGLEEKIELGSRWEGGVMILKPGEDTLKPKEIPIEAFFHKIVMVRDRLRVMEQRVNASNLSDEEKVNLQQYITRIYGSLTTFNVLFKYKEQYFVGDKSE